MNQRRVVITGMGTVNPLGHDVESTWSAILQCASGVSVNELFDASTFPTQFAAQVKNFDLQDDDGTHQHAGRHCRFAISAARQAWRQADLDQFADLDKSRLGIYLGSGEGSLDFDIFTSLIIDAWDDGKIDMVKWARLAQERMDLHRELAQESNMVLAHLAGEFEVRGPAFNTLTACAASTQAIGEAALQVRRGDVDVIITGGAHSMIHPYGITGFSRLTALSVRNDSPETASRPFDMTRDGFVLGEGSSILILEDYEIAKARGATILAELIGTGGSADAYRITDQDPHGDGAATAMRAALGDAKIKPEQIDYISAHGTATRQNDEVETKAIKVVFGELAGKIPVSSAKSMLGHLIAAAGATELITCVLALRDQMVPPTINYSTADPDCDLDYVPNKPRKAKLDIIMSNSFGFGGQNNSVIITKPQA